MIDPGWMKIKVHSLRLHCSLKFCVGCVDEGSRIQAGLESSIL